MLSGHSLVLNGASMMNAKQYVAEVHTIPCVLCAELGRQQESETQAHHVRHGNGLSQRAQDWLVCALCRDCHQGKDVLHGTRARFKIAKWDEMDALAATVQAMWRKIQ